MKVAALKWKHGKKHGLSIKNILILLIFTFIQCRQKKWTQIPIVANDYFALASLLSLVIFSSLICSQWQNPHINFKDFELLLHTIWRTNPKNKCYFSMKRWYFIILLNHIPFNSENASKPKKKLKRFCRFRKESAGFSHIKMW